MEAERDKKLINFSSKSLEMEEDRVSKLPNEILHHILSKVDMKEAVQTSILSKRWKNIWSSLPNLSFSFRSLAQQSGVNLSWSHHIDSFMPRFTNIVTRFLSHRDDSSSIHKFQLSSSHLASSDSRFVEKCLHYAINHGVQHLELDAFCRPAPVKFPDGFFSSKTLRVLKLKQYARTIFIPKPFILVNLKTLYLECFTFKDDDGGDDIYSFSMEPFSSFPNLEKLTLDCCEFSDLIISASKLKMLEISFSGPYFSREKKIEKISTPELSSFRYKGYVSLVCSKVVFPSLEEVYIDIVPVLESPYTDDIKKKMPENLVRILQQLGRAKFVTLTLSTIDVLQTDLHLLEHSPSPFPYIESLSLTNEPYMIHPMKTVPKPVMNYLTKGSSYRDSLVLKFPEGVEG